MTRSAQVPSAPFHATRLEVRWRSPRLPCHSAGPRKRRSSPGCSHRAIHRSARCGARLCGRRLVRRASDSREVDAGARVESTVGSRIHTFSDNCLWLGMNCSLGSARHTTAARDATYRRFFLPRPPPLPPLAAAGALCAAPPSSASSLTARPAARRQSLSSSSPAAHFSLHGPASKLYRRE